MLPKAGRGDTRLEQQLLVSAVPEVLPNKRNEGNGELLLCLHRAEACDDQVIEVNARSMPCGNGTENFSASLSLTSADPGPKHGTWSSLLHSKCHPH